MLLVKYEWEIHKEFQMWKLKKINDYCQENKALAYDLIRIYLGVGLFFRGLIFLIEPELVRSYLDEFGSQYLFLAVSHYVAFAHLAGGVLLCIGLLTRLSALVQVPALLGAVFYVNLGKGLLTSDALELSVMVLFMLVVVVVFGAGKLSMDHYLKTNPTQQDD